MPTPLAIVNVSTVFYGAGAVFPGIILGPGAGIGTYGDGEIVSTIGDAIEPHGPSPHDAATMIEGSVDTFVNGVPICALGDFASCGCYVINGSIDTFIG